MNETEIKLDVSKISNLKAKSISLTCKYNDVLNEKGYFSKYFYALSGVFALHPDYIKELVDNTTITYKDKYDVIIKLIDYIKENKEFNYNKSLVKKYYKLLI